MSDTALVWLVVGLVSTTAALAMAIALVRHVIVLGRALGRFRDEVEPVATAISEEGGRAASRASRLGQGLPRSRGTRSQGRR